MPSRDSGAARRASGRRRSRLRIEALEDRRLLSADPASIVFTASDSAAKSNEMSSADSTPAANANNITASLMDSSPSGGIALLSVASDTSSDANPGLPDLVPVRLSTPAKLDWDQQFQAEGTIQNIGGTRTDAPFVVDMFASPQAAIAPGALKVGSITIPSGLDSGATYNFNVTMRTPSMPSAELAANPVFFLSLAVDTANSITESDELNNGGHGVLGIDSSEVTVTPRLPSRLVPAGLSVSSGILDWGGTMRVSVSVRNEGLGDAPATNARVILVPQGDDPLGPRGYTIGSVAIPQVPADQTVSSSQDIRLPQFPPTLLANVGTFSVVVLVDADAVANPVVRPFAYQSQGLDWAVARITPKPSPVNPAQLADLAANAVTTPSSVAWGQTIDISARIANTGKSAASAFKVRFTLIQSDDPNAPALDLGSVSVNALAAGQATVVTGSFTLPARIPAGLNPDSTTGRILVKLDPTHSIDESNLDNNQLISLPIKLAAAGGATIVPNPVTTSAQSKTPGQSTAVNARKQASARIAARQAAIISIREHMLASRRAAKAAQAARLLASRDERSQKQKNAAMHLRIFPRVKPATKLAESHGLVHILPINQENDTSSVPNQST